MDAGALTETRQTQAAPAAATGWRRIGRVALRAEDWLLAGWVVLAAPLIALAGGSAGPFDSGHPIAGIAMLTGFCGAIACLATRNSDEAGRGGDPAGGSRAGANVLDSAAVGPLVGGLMLVGGTGFAELGLAPEAVLYPSVAAVLALSVMQSHLPRVPAAYRRALVTPYLLGAGGLFWGIVHAVTGGIDLRAAFGTSLAGTSSGAAAVLGVLTLCAAVYYAMLIYAPRQIAEREGGPVEWLARFGLFLVSVLVGLGWLSLLAS